MSDGKFNLTVLRDYFLKTNTTDISLKDLKKDEIVSLAILSIFDNKGTTVKSASYSYEKPDGNIDKNEFGAVSEKQYSKAVKDIQKALKKEMGNDFSNLKIPTYSEMSKMLADGKIEFDELSGIKPLDGEKTVAPADNGGKKAQGIIIPQKTDSPELSSEELGTWLANIDKASVLDIYRKVKNGTYDYKPSAQLQKTAQDAQNAVDNFVPNEEEAAEAQIKGKDAVVKNKNGQLIRRTNGVSGLYESYNYEGNNKEYSELMQYKPNGYKAIYYKRSLLPDSDGNLKKTVTVYTLDEYEKLFKVITAPGFEKKEYEDFNKNSEYERFMRYFKEAGYSDEETEAYLTAEDD